MDYTRPLKERKIWKQATRQQQGIDNDYFQNPFNYFDDGFLAIGDQ